MSEIKKQLHETCLITLDKEVHVNTHTHIYTYTHTHTHKKTVIRGHESSIRGNPPVDGADSCMDLTYGSSEMRSVRKIKVRRLSVWNVQLVTTRSIV